MCEEFNSGTSIYKGPNIRVRVSPKDRAFEKFEKPLLLLIDK